MMTLSQGTRLGPYEILNPLGAGGMGEVYRAKDTRLGRTVAIKVLGRRSGATPEMEKRFQNEAKAISQLQHPNICTLFDVGRQEEVAYLVMEYLDGKALSEKIEGGALPLEQVLQIGRQVAAALEVAHRGGIVHRDLKPGNIVITESGAKLLDFGLAKLRAASEGVRDPGSVEVTESIPESDLTGPNTVLGTLPYMAPEQFEGREADARSDIWALGCMLYEMITGKRAFQGASRASLITSILTTEPRPVSEIQPATPGALGRVIRTCLAKDPERRWQNARDVELQLEAIAGGAAEETSVSKQPEKTRGTIFRLIAAGITGALVVAGLWFAFRPKTSPPVSFRLQMPLPADERFLPSVEVAGVAVSPDGLRIAFAAREPDGPPRIWLRRLSDSAAVPLEGTEGATSLLWSPDGKSIAFFGRGKLKRLDLAEKAVAPICDVTPYVGYAGTWGKGGDILFASVNGEAIYSISSAGGERKTVLRPETANGVLIAWPLYLPDGKRFLYLMKDGKGSRSLMLHEPGKPDKKIAEGSSRVQLLDPETIVFVKEGTLLTQSFNSKSGRLEGAPVSIAYSVDYFYSSGWANVAAANGTLVYSTSMDADRLVLTDRGGREERDLVKPGGYNTASVSPDGRKLLFDRQQTNLGTYDVWMLDLERGIETPIAKRADTDVFGIWLPDGQEIVYSSILSTFPQLFRKDLRTGEEKPLTKSAAFQIASDVTRDGQTLAYMERNTESGIWEARTLRLSDSKSDVLPTCSEVRFSPDGRYMAFLTDEAGSLDAYVAPRAFPLERTRLSKNGAVHLRWSLDGREIFYLSTADGLVSQPIQTTPSLSLGNSVKLIPAEKTAHWTAFDVFPDGQKFVAVISGASGAAPSLSVVVGSTPR